MARGTPRTRSNGRHFLLGPIAYTQRSMPAVRLIFTLVLLSDVLGWYLLARLLRGMRRAKLWRGALAAVMTAQMLLLGSRLIPPRLAWTVNRHVPLPLVVQQYLWHLGVLPGTILIYLAVRGVAATVRRMRLKATDSARIGQQPPHPDPLPLGTGGEGIRPGDRGEWTSRRRFIAATAALTPP